MAFNPSELRPHYSRFLNSERVLLTGHSHQAWPDVAEEGVLEAFNDAALHVDDKWSFAMGKADVLRTVIADYLGVDFSEIALGQNSHELVSRYVSGLNLRRRTIVTTDGEFHSMRRQLQRLSEEGIRIKWVPVEPMASLGERLAEAIDEDTAGVMVSTVLFQTSAVVPNLSCVIERAAHFDSPVLLDAYHAYGALPNTVDGLRDADVFVTGGGYKYAQWGEGCCWMRVPPATQMRPVYTGWFSDFSTLDGSQEGPVRYGQTPADRFAGSTYDPTSHYRAARVVRFFEEHGLTIQALRVRSLHQTQMIIDALKGWPILTPQTEARGGFVAVRVPKADTVVRALRQKQIFVDSRGDILRFGPAPYTTDDEIHYALGVFREVACK